MNKKPIEVLSAGTGDESKVQPSTCNQSADITPSPMLGEGRAEEDTLIGNRYIAEFMGLENPFRNYVNLNGLPVPMRYNLSWDWLMPVVEKIERYKCLGVDKTYVQISDKHCAIWNYFDVKEFLRMTGDDKNEDGKFKVRHSASTKIEATWLAVVDFIKWHKSKRP